MCIRDRGVAEQGGPVQLFHQGLGELLKGVAEDQDLGEAAQLVQKCPRAGQGVDLGNGSLNLPQPQAVLPQYALSLIHIYHFWGCHTQDAQAQGDLL